MAVTRPQVVVDPQMRFGAPNVRGVSYHVLTDAVAAGEDVDSVAAEYDITRNDVLVACWYAGLYGTRTEQTWLKVWALEWHPLMWRGEWDAVEDPPVKPKRGKR